MNNHLFFRIAAVASVLLTINGATIRSKVVSTNPAHDNCNLLKDQTDEYFELVFKFENTVEDLEAMRDS